MMKYRHEFVSGITNQVIAESQLSPNELGGPPQDLIANVVAVGVVDLFEAVQCQHHEYERRAVAFRAASLLLEESVHVSGVRGPGQIISKGRLVRSLDRQCVVYRGSGIP